MYGSNAARTVNHPYLAWLPAKNTAAIPAMSPPTNSLSVLVILRPATLRRLNVMPWLQTAVVGFATLALVGAASLVDARGRDGRKLRLLCNEDAHAGQRLGHPLDP